MNMTSAHPGSPSQGAVLDGLLAATNAFRNGRAFALMGLTLLAAILVGGCASYLGMAARAPVLAGLGMLLAVLIGFYGMNAVGIALMQEAQGQQGSMADALLLSLFTGHRLICVALIEMLIVLAVAVAVALVLVVCKIPYLGPILLTFVFPVAAVVLGVVVFSLFYIMFPLAGPAVWSGCTTMQAIARLNVIARTRLISVVLQQVILFFILALTAGVIFTVLGIGLGITSGMTAGIVGVGGGDRLMALFMGYGSSFGGYGMGYGSGHLIASAIGGSLLVGAGFVVPALIATKGMCMIYLKAAEGIDFTAEEARMDERMRKVREKAEEARVRARQAAEQQMQKAREAAAAAQRTGQQPEASAAVDAVSAPPYTPDAAAVPAASTCPACAASVLPEDAFCGECGHRLK